MTARLPKFVPALNVPQIVAIMAIPGRLVPSNFGPTEVVFDLVDGRPWYVPQVIADEIYAAGFQARQQLEVTAVGKKKTEVRIIPVQQRIQPRSIERDYTPELEKSLHQVAGPEPYWADTAMQTAPAHGISNDSPNTGDKRQISDKGPRSDHGISSDSPNTGNGNAGSKTTAATACMMASMCSAVDAIVEVQAYATRKGMGLTFSEESVRAIGLSIYIDACRNGGPR